MLPKLLNHFISCPLAITPIVNKHVNIAKHNKTTESIIELRSGIVARKKNL